MSSIERYDQGIPNQEGRLEWHQYWTIVTKMTYIEIKFASD